METSLRVSNYQEYKAALDNQLKEAAEGFVRIGYLLKLARDTDILAGSGYANVNEFAKAEYGMDKSMVSRFININTKFAENGCSEYLKEQYRGFGYAKLAIMLQLPDVINETLTPDFSKSEIQAIKDEVDEEQKVSDIEVLIEGEKEEHKALESNLAKVLHQLCEDEPELFVKLHERLSQAVEVEEIQEVLAPSGSQIYSVRIQGVGRIMLSLHSEDMYVAVIAVRTNTKEQYTWEDVCHCLDEMIPLYPGEAAEKVWEHIYNREFPKKVEVAPVQPEEKKKAVKKEPKVTKAKKPEKEKKDADRKEAEEKSAPVPENTVPESETVTSESKGEAECSREEIPGAEDKASEESMDEDIPVEEIPECDVTVEEKTVETAEIPNAEGVHIEIIPGVEAVIEDVDKAMAAAHENELRGEIFAVPQHCREDSDAGQQNIVCEIDLTFRERIQTAEWILEAVKRDNKSEARMYCRDLLRLLGDWED